MPETERLYFADAYTTVFDAQVVARDERGGSSLVALDRSAFYPEGGGQPADRGALNGVHVTDVQVEDGVVWHTLAAPLAEDHVQGEVDWARRFDHMQQHHGQHLLSAAFEHLYGTRTLSFHLGAAVVTIDIAAGSLAAEQVAAVEDLVNQVIWDDQPVDSRFVSPEELATLPLRKPPNVTGAVRVVSVPDFDYSACGGTHPRSTGGVGMLHVRRWERRGDGTRVEFLCGGRAVRDYRSRDAALLQLAGALSTSVDDIAEAVVRTRAAEERSRKALETATEQLLRYEAQDLVARAEPVGILRVVWRAFDARPADEVRALAKIIADNGCVALLGTRGERTHMVFARAEALDVDCGALLRGVLAPLGGRGGGQAALAQGGLPDPSALDTALRAAVAQLGK